MRFHCQQTKKGGKQKATPTRSPKRKELKKTSHVLTQRQRQQKGWRRKKRNAQKLCGKLLAEEVATEALALQRRVNLQNASLILVGPAGNSTSSESYN